MISNSKHQRMIYGYIWSTQICSNDMFDMPSTQLTSFLGCWPSILWVKSSKIWVMWVLGVCCVYLVSSRRFCNPNTTVYKTARLSSWVWSSTDPWYHAIQMGWDVSSTLEAQCWSHSLQSPMAMIILFKDLRLHTMHLWQSSYLLH